MNICFHKPWCVLSVVFGLHLTSMYSHSPNMTMKVCSKGDCSVLIHLPWQWRHVWTVTACQIISNRTWWIKTATKKPTFARFLFLCLVFRYKIHFLIFSHATEWHFHKHIPNKMTSHAQHTKCVSTGTTARVCALGKILQGSTALRKFFILEPLLQAKNVSVDPCNVLRNAQTVRSTGIASDNNNCDKGVKLPSLF